MNPASASAEMHDAPQNPSHDTARIQGSWAVVPAAIAVFYFPVVTFAGYLFHYDLIGFNAPVRKFFFDHIRHGQMPLWCPDYAGGFPLFFEGQLGPLYPLNYLFFPWLHPGAAINASVVAHALIAGLGTWAWLRRRFSDDSAILGALGYTFSSYLVFRVVHLMLFQSACWFPWLFLFLDRFLEDGKIRNAVPLGLTMGLMMTTGHQQGPIIAAIVAGLYTLARLVPIVSRTPRFAARSLAPGFALSVVLAAGLSAIVIAGVLDLLRESVRQTALSSEFVLAQSLKPELLIRLLSPAHNGRMADATWQLTGYNEKEIAVYLGLPALLLAPLGFWKRRDSAAVAHAVVVVVCLLLMMGASGPFAALMMKVPILNRMRIPTRYLLGATISLAWLGAAGWEAVRSASRGDRAVFAIPLAGLALWSVLVWSAAFHTYGAGLWTGVANPSIFDLAGRGLFHDLLIRQFIALALAAAILMRGRFRESTGRIAAVTALAMVCVFADLALHGARENPVGPPSIYGPFASTNYLQAHVGEGRIYSTSDHRRYGAGGWANSLDGFGDAIADVPHATTLLFGLRGTEPSTPLVFARTERVMAGPSVTWLRRQTVGFLVSRQDKPLPQAAKFGDVGVYVVPQPARHYALVGRVIPVSSADAAFEEAGRPLVDMDDHAYVEGWNRPPLEGGGGGVEVVDERTDRRVLNVTADAPSFLIVRENFHPDWKALVDGKPAETYRADYLQWGLVVPAGTHVVTLVFAPAWFKPLLALYGLTWVAGLAYLALPRKKRGRDRAARNPDPIAARIEETV